MSDLEIHLSDVHVAHGELRVPYALSNHTAAPVYVYNPVSYTHLDVYKRQLLRRPRGC